VLRPLRSAPLLWALAIALALVSARAVGTALADLDARRAALGAPVPVVVADVDLAAGTTARAPMLRIALVPASLRPDDAVTALADADGRVVTVPLLAGAAVTTRHLGDGLGDAVPAGQRAVRVRVDGSVRPEPGATVDVVGVVTSLDGQAEPDVVAGLTVLAVDPPSDVQPDAVGVLLLVDEHDAPRLAALATAGSVALALAPTA
jgi:Flp pilus assembly protein CpaB